MANGNPFYVEPQNNLLPGIMALGDSVRRYGDIKREEDKQKKAEDRFAKIQAEAQAAMDSEDPQQMHEFAVRNPEWSQAMNGFMQWSSEGSRKNYLSSAAELRANPTEEKAREVVERRQKYLQSIGAQNTNQTDSFLEQFQNDPDPLKKDAIKSLDMSVASVATKDEWNQYAEAAGIVEPKSGGTPKTKMGKLNYDYEQGLISEEEYEAEKKRIEKGGDYAPTSHMKLIRERQELIDNGMSPDSPVIKSFDNKIMGADINAEDLTPEATLYYGTVFESTGKMPSFGMGKGALEARKKIANAGARVGFIKEMRKQGVEVPPELMLTDNEQSVVDAAVGSIDVQTNVKAIQGGMNFLEKQKASMGSFVDNLNMQIAEVNKIAEDLITSDTRLLNLPIRAIRGKLKGSATQAVYDMFITEITRETSKLSQSATQSIAAMPQGEIEEWNKIHDKNLSTKDMLEVLEYTRKAAEFRMSSVDNQIAKTRQRLKNISSGDEKPGAQLSGTVVNELPPGSKQIGTSGGKPVYETPDGKRFLGE